MTKGMDSLIKKVSSIPDLIEEVIDEQKDNILDEVKAHFRQGTNPNDGQSWTPLKDGSKATLYKTGNLYNSYGVSFSESSNQLRIYNSAPYASYHQHGTKHLPRRQIIPDYISEYIKDILFQAIKEKLKRV